MEINNNDIPLEGMSQHVSYSALSTYTDCGQKYYLTRIKKVQEEPSWWLAGGSAVHTATEKFDKQFPSADFTDAEIESFAPTQTFSEAFSAEVQWQIAETGQGEEHFRAAGRATREFPDKENDKWWESKGREMLVNWIFWRRGSGWNFWYPEPSTPAIELGIDYKVGDDTYIKMFIDRVMVLPNGEMVVLDLKTGSRTPSSDLQLAVYAAGIEEQFGVRPKYGAYWMARTGITSPLVDLEYLPKERVEKLVVAFDKARKAGIFIPNLSNCGYCSVAQHCEWSKK